MADQLLKDLFKPSPCLSQETILKYLAGELPPQVQHQVENHLLDCPLCNDAVEAFQEYKPTRFPGSFEEWKSLQAQGPMPTGGLLKQLRPFFRIAAVLAVLITAWWLLQRPTSPDDLYAKFYQPYTLDIPVSSRSTLLAVPLPASLVNALQQYDSGHYEKALAGLEEVLSADPDNEPANFYAGMACLQIGRFDEAYAFLLKVIATNGNYASQARWYLALIKLKQNDIEGAKELLQQITKTNGYQHTQAAALLQLLE